MSKRAELQFIPHAGGETEVLFESPEGIPLLWFLAFGTRNNWVPDQSVKERGGAAAERNRFDSSVEDSQYRLEEAESVLREQPRVWPFYAPVSILLRKVAARPKNGVLRLAAPWATHDPRIAEQFKSSIAFVENAVNMFAQDRFHEASLMLDNLAVFCPAVYDGLGEAPKAGGTVRLDSLEPELRIAFGMLGENEGENDAIIRVAREIIPPAMQAWRALPPPPPPPAPKAVPQKKGPPKPNPNAIPKGPIIMVADEPPGGIVARLGRLFGRK